MKITYTQNQFTQLAYLHKNKQPSCDNHSLLHGILSLLTLSGRDGSRTDSGFFGSKWFTNT